MYRALMKKITLPGPTPLRLTNPALVRWLHLSDFHVGKDGYEQNRLFAEIIKEVTRWRLNTGFEPHYVFLTGDIANNGLAKEYEAFRSGFLTPLRSAIGSSALVIPIPGNHDVARPSTDALARQPLLVSASRFFDSSKEGKVARDQVIPRFKHYKKLMSADISPDWLVSNNGAATHIQDIGETKVGVAGLNTAWLAKDHTDKGQLTPGYRLVDAALKSIAHCHLKFVLGHHPLSWWHDREETHIRTLFARHNVIYLHGHMHRSEGRTEEGGSDSFLVLQAGAAFQARDGDSWINGFSWGEADLRHAEVRVSPRYWDSVNREWPPQMGSISLARRIDQTDWWKFPLPGQTQRPEAEGTQSSEANIPGWTTLTDAELSSLPSQISAEDAQNFFDGAEPDWALARSPQFPVRHQAQALLKSVESFEGKERPQFALVRGPTAEGKSMALRQIVVASARCTPGLKILWHLDETKPLKVDDFLQMAIAGQRWMVASDHGDLIVGNLRDLAQRLKRAGRSDVQFVIASHDADWRAAEGDSAIWASFTHFGQARLGGLPGPDAMAIAATWLAFDVPSCIGSLREETVESLAARLSASAEDEGSREGALFGALLSLRHGSDLQDHVRKLLQRLDGFPVAGDGKVGRAFRLISAMHAEGLPFLSRRVLQEVLGCDEAKLQSNILRMLATEAAAGGGIQLRTRHRRIAEATLTLCQEVEGDSGGLYVSLVQAAINLGRVKGAWLGNLSDWEYGVATHFFKTDRCELAVRVAWAVSDVVPSNSHYTVNLARMLRESGNAEGAAQVLAHAPSPEGNRAFWSEWGACSGLLEDFVSNAWLHAFSLSDQVSQMTPSLLHAKQALTGLAQAFAGLHSQFERQEFMNARAAVTALALTISNDTFGTSILQKHANASAHAHQPATAQDALEALSRGLAAATTSVQAKVSLVERLGDPTSYGYAALLRRLGPFPSQTVQ